MKKSQLYTATGDEGLTSLVGGARVKKTSVRLEAYGTIDELNSHVGLLAAIWRESVDDDPEIVGVLREIQNRLFDIGAYLATDNSGVAEQPCRGVGPEQVGVIESQIDKIDGDVPPMKCFVLPGGARMAAMAHVARTVARRAERRVLSLADAGVAVDANVLKYLNRLSDLLFAIARLANYRLDLGDIPWHPGGK